MIRITKPTWFDLTALVAAVGAVGLLLRNNPPNAGASQLLNVSYDPTRELYRDINAAFAEDTSARRGGRIQIAQSHGGSSRQARLVAGGDLDADVVTLGLPSDVDVLAKRGLISKEWTERLPSWAGGELSEPWGRASPIFGHFRGAAPKQRGPLPWPQPHGWGSQCRPLIR